MFSLLIAGALRAAEPGTPSKALLWRDPTDIESRDLLFGSGGKNDMPPGGPFQFIKEEMSGTNPKFTVKDSKGVKWKVKLGAEARPETVATRLVWAVGYFTDEDYFVERAELTDVPFAELKRLRDRISSDSTVRNARFEREHKGAKGKAPWSWKSSSFAGSRELNGLRTLMAVLNNWDLKEENNSIYHLKSGEDIYAVSDLGATFGTTSYVVGHKASRGNLNAYEHSSFISHKSSQKVSFATPGLPALISIFNPHQFFMRLKLESIGRDIPRTDARWIGTLLAHLSPAQIRDAFRSAGYPAHDVEAFARVVEKRIAELNAL